MYPVYSFKLTGSLAYRGSQHLDCAGTGNQATGV